MRLAAVKALEEGSKTQAQLAEELGIDRSINYLTLGEKLVFNQGSAVEAGRSKAATLHKEKYPLISKFLIEYLDARSRILMLLLQSTGK